MAAHAKACTVIHNMVGFMITVTVTLLSTTFAKAGIYRIYIPSVYHRRFVDVFLTIFQRVERI